MRVLHLVQPLSSAVPWFSHAHRAGETGGEGSLLAIRALLRESELGGWHADRHLVCVIGGSASRLQTRVAGVDGCEHTSPALGQASRAAPAIRSLLRRCGPLDGIVCWGTNLRTLARKVAGAAPAWVEVDAQSGAVCRLDAIRGTIGPAMGVAMPRAWGATGTNRLRVHYREALSIPAHERVIAMISDSANPAFAPTLLGSAAMLHVAHMPCTYVFPAECEGLDRVGRSIREGTYISRAILSSMPALAGALAADVAVCVPGQTRTNGASIAWLAHRATRAGVRVVAPQAWVDSWGSGASIVPADAARAPDIARVLLNLFEQDPPVAAPTAAASNTPHSRQQGLRATLAAALASTPAPTHTPAAA